MLTAIWRVAVIFYRGTINWGGFIIMRRFTPRTGRIDHWEHERYENRDILLKDESA